MKIRSLFLLLIIIWGITLPVSASATITFRDMSLSGYQNFHIYEVNGTGTYDLGIYNSSTEALDLAPDGNHSYAYVAQFVPSTTDYFADPMLAVSSWFDYTNSHYPSLIMIVFLACLLGIAVYLARKG